MISQHQHSNVALRNINFYQHCQDPLIVPVKYQTPTRPIHRDYNIQCRICLEEQPQANQTVVSPCRCIGTVKYVHQKCIKEWISRKLRSNWSENVSCEMCQFEYVFTKEITSVLDCSLFKQRYQENKKQCIIFILTMFLLLLLIVGLISLLTVTQKLNQQLYIKLMLDTTFISGLVVTIITVLSLAFLIDMRYFISYCFFRRSVITIGIKNYTECLNKKSLKFSDLKVHIR